MRPLFRRIRLTARLFNWCCAQFNPLTVLFFVMAAFLALWLGWTQVWLDNMTEANIRLTAVCQVEGME
jgi:hypothetical protein